MTELEKAQENRANAVEKAAAAWANAPAHIKAMAGAYVGPLIAALFAISGELEELKRD